jgi:antitoxin (DNA-binding transcriptional repressor) of toxin-antitoxin stability system
LTVQIVEEDAMSDVNFTELRSKASEYIDRIEKGETIRIFRHGRLVALLVPPTLEGRLPFSNPLSRPGVSLSSAVLAERAES